MINKQFDSRSKNLPHTHTSRHQDMSARHMRGTEAKLELRTAQEARAVTAHVSAPTPESCLYVSYGNSPLEHHEHKMTEI